MGQGRTDAMNERNKRRANYKKKAIAYRYFEKNIYSI